MNISEADKIIAEFMGYSLRAYQDGDRWCRNGNLDYPPKYSQSLDALVPVWEKLGATDFKWNVDYCKDDYETLVYDCELVGCRDNGKQLRTWEAESEQGKTIQQAAAIATAKAIKELGK